MDRLDSKFLIESEAVVLHDVSDRVKSWGQRGILAGGLFGFAIGAVFVAIPQTANVLAFGVAGTLLVAAMEGAVIAGAFSACAAALYTKGAHRGRSAKLCRDMPLGRRRSNVGWQDGDIPLSNWPARWSYPTPQNPHPRTPELCAGGEAEISFRSGAE
jgi:hypothetical protein